jgi:hypothetical protein
MHKILCALLLSLATLGSAGAADFDIDLVQSKQDQNLWSANFGNTINDPSDAWFTDTYTFAPTLAGLFSVDGTVVNFYTKFSQSIFFDEVLLNGVAMSKSTVNGGGTTYHLATLPSTGFTGPLTLTVTGFAGGESSAFSASYSGLLNITTVAAVPEPETYAMMLAGLGMVGMLARRRRARV